MFSLRRIFPVKRLLLCVIIFPIAKDRLFQIRSPGVSVGVELLLVIVWGLVMRFRCFVVVIGGHMVFGEAHRMLAPILLYMRNHLFYHAWALSLYDFLTSAFNYIDNFLLSLVLRCMVWLRIQILLLKLQLEILIELVLIHQLLDDNLLRHLVQAANSRGGSSLKKGVQVGVHPFWRWTPLPVCVDVFLIHYLS